MITPLTRISSSGVCSTTMYIQNRRPSKSCIRRNLLRLMMVKIVCSYIRVFALVFNHACKEQCIGVKTIELGV